MPHLRLVDHPMAGIEMRQDCSRPAQLDDRRARALFLAQGHPERFGLQLEGILLVYGVPSPWSASRSPRAALRDLVNDFVLHGIGDGPSILAVSRAAGFEGGVTSRRASTPPASGPHEGV